MAITINVALDNVSANSVSADQLSGEKGRFVAAGDMVTLYAVSSADTMTIQFGTANDIFIDDKRFVTVGTTLNKSDHVVGQFVATNDGELSLKFRETGGVSTSDIRASIEVQQAGIDF
jgi:hypothetical protein